MCIHMCVDVLKIYEEINKLSPRKFLEERKVSIISFLTDG